MRFDVRWIRPWCEDEGGAAQRGLLAQLVGAAVLRDLLSLSVLQAQLRGPHEFHMPWLPGLPPIAPSPASALLAHAGTLVLMTCALMLVAQRGLRVAASILLLGYGYAFLDDAPSYTNNGVLLLLWLGLVIVEPLGPTARVWPVRVGQLALLAVYAGGVCAKLGSYWLSGNLLREILNHYSGNYARLVGWERPVLFALGAKLALAAEIAIGCGLWFRRTRLAAMASGVAFHGAIEVFLPVRMFAPLVIGGYALFLDDERARAWLAHTTRLGRSLYGQTLMIGALWLSSLLGYPTRPSLAVDLLMTVALAKLFGRDRGAAAANATAPAIVATAAPTTSLPREPARLSATATVIAFGLLQLLLLSKPAWGMSNHFAWRMFSESLVMRVNPEVMLDHRWRKVEFPETQGRWREDGFRYQWSSLSEERVYLQGYADWLIATFPDATPLRLVTSYRRDGAPAKTAIFKPRE